MSARPLHVLQVAHGYPPEAAAGAELYTQRLAHALAARGHRVTVLARSPPLADEPDFTLREDAEGAVRVLRMTQRLGHRRHRESYREPRAEAVFRAVLRADRPDVVHFQHLLHWSSGLVELARASGLPTVLHAHDLWALCARVQMLRPDGQRCERNMGSGCFACLKGRGLAHVERLARLDRWPGSRALAAAGLALTGARGRRRAAEYRDVRARERAVPAAFRAADVVLCPSAALRERLLTLGLDPRRVLRSDLGLPPVAPGERRRPVGPARRFGYVGSLAPHKGVHVLLAAFRGLAERGATLELCGPFDPERDPYHAALAEAAGAGVRFRGAFEARDRGAVYGGLDALVVPSLWFENAPLVVREAFQARLPVIVSDLGGLVEAVRDGVDGLRVPPGDAAALQRAMLRLLDEPTLAAELAAAAPAVTTCAEDAAATERLYRELLAAPSADGPRHTDLPARPYWIPTPRRARAGAESSPTLEEVRA